MQITLDAIGQRRTSYNPSHCLHLYMDIPKNDLEVKAGQARKEEHDGFTLSSRCT